MNQAFIMARPRKATTQLRDAEATRNSILDAAEEEFAVGGLLGARTEAIAARTGVTKAMIHYYFDTKEKLYVAVLERAVAARIRNIQEGGLNELEPEEALRIFVQGVIDNCGRNVHISSIMLFEAIQNKGFYYKEIVMQSLYKPLQNILARGVESGAFRKLDPMHVSVNIIGICVFYFCARENLKHLWPPGTDLMSPEMLDAHEEETIKMVMASTRP